MQAANFTFRLSIRYFGIQEASWFVRDLGSNTPALLLRDKGNRTDKAVPPRAIMPVLLPRASSTKRLKDVIGSC